MTSFNYYKQVKKSSLKTLIAAGVNVRIALTQLKKSMPYMFYGKKELDSIDTENAKHNI